LEWLRRHPGMRTPTGAWVSDFAPHPFWVYRDLDLHLVMHETAIAPALAAEAHAVVEVCAPPVTSDFAPGDLARERSVLGLGVDAFVALVSTGGYAFGDVEAGVDALLNANPTVQVVVACGRNDPLLHKLLARGLPPNRLQALGWVQDMPTRIRAADVVVTNAGGATALEWAAGLPGTTLPRPPWALALQPPTLPHWPRRCSSLSMSGVRPRPTGTWPRKRRRPPSVSTVATCWSICCSPTVRTWRRCRRRPLRPAGRYRNGPR